MRVQLTIAVLAVLLAGCNGAAGGPNGKATTTSASATSTIASAAPGQLTPKSLDASTLNTTTGPLTATTTGGSAVTGGSPITGTPTTQSTSSVIANGSTTTSASGSPAGTAVPALVGTAPGSTPAAAASGGLPPALAGTAPGSTPTTSTPSDPHVAYALNAINTSRATQNLPPYVLDPNMSSCALRHSQDCYNCAGGDENQFPNCAHRDAINGDTCGGNAENQGVGGPGDQDQAFQQVHDGMISEGPTGGHYQALMNTGYTTVGIGLSVDPNGIVWVTEEFR